MEWNAMEAVIPQNSFQYNCAGFLLSYKVFVNKYLNLNVSNYVFTFTNRVHFCIFLLPWQPKNCVILDILG